uniref:Uncharacterized protein n=1 Tax=Anguilla anguilla TaxID=7936 RepID=A0A0E9RDX8_ANGAN
MIHSHCLSAAFFTDCEDGGVRWWGVGLGPSTEQVRIEHLEENKEFQQGDLK